MSDLEHQESSTDPVSRRLGWTNNDQCSGASVAYLHRGDGKKNIGSGFAWMTNTASHDSDQNPTLQCKICPPFS
ncbi:hypothetical protein KSC_109930 [Ktedonobacter sp. SOSP1-52]|uniref:hypothetical protein n=1 Tax=Ktedonobacter sp. SOSP1-52 TaxID=2778366 RepID=UPI0019163BD3|nr:hypothetical protein [Ktedonobacter sp. SOSP1-52]GHO72101.1 hypothetical protein KSC_109930 [Ktedonobacter sp. SOSP1-52]